MSLFVNMDGSVVLFDEDNRKEIWSKNLIA